MSTPHFVGRGARSHRLQSPRTSLMQGVAVSRSSRLLRIATALLARQTSRNAAEDRTLARWRWGFGQPPALPRLRPVPDRSADRVPRPRRRWRGSRVADPARRTALWPVCDYVSFWSDPRVRRCVLAHRQRTLRCVTGRWRRVSQQMAGFPEHVPRWRGTQA